MEVVSDAGTHNSYQSGTMEIVLIPWTCTPADTPALVIFVAHHIDFYTKKHYIKSRIWHQGEGIISLWPEVSAYRSKSNKIVNKYLLVSEHRQKGE